MDMLEREELEEKMEEDDALSGAAKPANTATMDVAMEDDNGSSQLGETQPPVDQV